MWEKSWCFLFSEPLWGEGPVTIWCVAVVGFYLCTGHDSSASCFVKVHALHPPIVNIYIYTFIYIYICVYIYIHIYIYTYISSCATSLFEDCPLTGIVGCHICMASPSETAGVEVKEALGITGLPWLIQSGRLEEGVLVVPQKWIRPGIQDFQRHMKAILSHGQCCRTAIFSTTDINMEMEWILYGFSIQYVILSDLDWIWWVVISHASLDFLTSPSFYICLLPKSSDMANEIKIEHPTHVGLFKE